MLTIDVETVQRIETRVTEILEAYLAMDPTAPGFQEKEFALMGQQVHWGLAYLQERYTNIEMRRSHVLRIIPQIATSPEEKKRMYEEVCPFVFDEIGESVTFRTDG